MADIEVLMPLIKQFMPFAQERMGFQDPPRLFLKGDSDNAANPLGRTAFYDPAEKAVTLYITGRHPKDIMRSLSHELVHHCQNCNGEFDNAGEMVKHRDGTIGVYVKDPFGNYLEYIWYSDQQKEVFLKDG